MAEESTYGIAAALTEALEAVVFADNSAANKAYDMIEKYAYGEMGDEDGQKKMNNAKSSGASMKTLAMAEFTFYDSDNNARKVSIPKITMIPLPLLHVTEATFDIEMATHIVDSGSGSTDDETAEEIAEKKIKIAKDISALLSKPLKNRDENFNLNLKLKRRELQLLEIKQKKIYMRPLTADITKQQLEIVKKSSSIDKESLINIKVKVELQQSELPEGIKLLLQAAAHSLQVAATELNQ